MRQLRRSQLALSPRIRRSGAIGNTALASRQAEAFGTRPRLFPTISCQSGPSANDPEHGLERQRPSRPIDRLEFQSGDSVLSRKVQHDCENFVGPLLIHIRAIRALGVIYRSSGRFQRMTRRVMVKNPAIARWAKKGFDGPNASSLHSTRHWCAVIGVPCVPGVGAVMQR